MGGPRAAVVLTAGMRIRLREVLADRPKGLLHLGSLTPIQRSSATLYAHHGEPIVLLARYRSEACPTLSGPTAQGDEGYAYGAPGRLAMLSTSRLPHLPLPGEFVGISRISTGLLAAMCAHCETNVTDCAAHRHDDCLTDGSAADAVHMHPVDDPPGGEIDDPPRYPRAVTHLLPALPRQREVHAAPA